jgi:hypothetical protein
MIPYTAPEKAGVDAGSHRQQDFVASRIYRGLSSPFGKNQAPSPVSCGLPIVLTRDLRVGRRAAHLDAIRRRVGSHGSCRSAIGRAVDGLRTRLETTLSASSSSATCASRA